ncbi:type III restriction-modification system endonuclease [Methanobacterium formicicum]|uniref:Restriction endonuclease n=1 Tax=Methanobacterium formicicum TaxID=2162 RepID=A0A090I495_METFO|nr:DEAD/DEAH box helicase family protein [Methanobacterium formicicum]MDH2658956.1 DEAD/DEAH box helicase family protein [Methanobacterium formicicum]CEA14168.1 restriction endonuclease [Methanobacterium formicicum]
MKLKFDPNLEYQDEAISAIVDLFEGQNSMQSYFTVPGVQVGLYDAGQGIGNRLEISNDDILENLKKVQLQNFLAPSETLSPNNLNFDIEMETGTGKTYVYLKTVFELNKKYGFTKFIIVVPSIAIKEGVYKAIQMTRDHFKGLYDNVIYDSFIYDSQKLEQVRNFAVNSNIQIMIINIDAFRRSFTDPTKETKANIIHRENDKLSGMKPIELIQETNPIVIIDEPQSTSATVKAKEAIASLNPLCTLQYSATHKEIHNLVYKLDAIDAYDKGLVKQIEVASFESADYHNKAYLKLVSVDNKKSPITAKIEIDSFNKGKTKRKTVTVKQGDDLSSRKLGNREIYEGYVVNEIYCEEGNEYVDFTNREDVLAIGKPVGDIDDLLIKRQQIRKTIEEHLNKELKLNPLGIKVLSLFFIDKVANYRYYDEEGNPQKGIYAEIFEEEYKKVISKQKYSTLLKEIDLETPADGVHNGYFSQDKKGVLKDTRGNTLADDDTYSLIMKDKEKLLSFDSKLRFIFSHSALREGWDNPNVFQICTLNETRSTIKKRQEIGRGLRLCVNQEGERIKDNQINTLTVMANESYEDFAKTLQKEIEDDEGIKFGIIQKHTFASISFENDKGELEHLGSQASEEIFNHFKDKGYIDAKGKVQDELKIAIKQKAVEIPEKYQQFKEDIEAAARKLTKKLDIKNLNDKKEVKINKQVYLSEEFKAFWDKIKYKTTYAVDFDSQELINNCSKAMDENLDVKTPKLIYTKAGLLIKGKGIESFEKQHGVVHSEEDEILLPDIITFLQNETYLTRRTLVDILIKSDTLKQFKRNPQQYMEDTLKIISSQMNHMIVDGIKYTKIGDSEYYAQELFNETELFGYLSKNMLESERSVYDHVIYDSEIEKGFAERFEEDENIILYAKLPPWFKIPTPLGSYNPDWAVLLDKEGEQKLYFVLETKGNVDIGSLRQTEADKIKCGKKHFEALSQDVEFKAVDNFNSFIENI